ncbi:hypothetical protein LAG90_16230 [Marinilongibacter aquaticus]|uniref:hypothetical protein n=1 Tax=Marinilongibacter aquaticus TaxID=2975157 RepID=UPI0021BD1A4E|nr:hypothetical protein [Marinilongibacter aquaticus]UBM58352.1 hypothetical protein LAG90_16230 [Marinilongibacter aquaticus]
MPITQHANVVGIFPEAAFNKVIKEVMLQMPDVFNYASAALMGQSLCSPIRKHPVKGTMDFPTCTEVPKIPLPGLPASAGLDFCIQITELKVDFQPSNSISLPSELGNLAVQEFALKGKACCGVSCGNRTNVPIPGKDKGKQLKDGKAKEVKKDTGLLKDLEKVPYLPVTLPHLNCFCLELFAKMAVVRDSTSIRLQLLGIEIKDISPIGLENIIECYLFKLLNKVVFPKIMIKLEDLVFSVGEFFTVMPAAISATVPYNPNVSSDKLTLFINLNP